MAYWVLDEGPYLPEYFEFHILQGVDKFVLYDNGSTDETYEVCLPYMKAGLLEIRRYPPHITQRNNFFMMDHLCKEQEGHTKWLHFHAIDERIWCPDGRSIPEVLKDYEDQAGLVVGWKLFNSGGHATKAPGLITERFTSESNEPNHHIKTIVQPGLATGHAGNPHIFKYSHGNFAVDQHKNKVNSPWHKPAYPMTELVNHHYVTMSKEEFNQKANKGLLDHPGAENVRRKGAETQWDGLHSGIKGVNTDLLKFTEPVKDALRKRYAAYPELYKKVQRWYNL